MIRITTFTFLSVLLACVVFCQKGTSNTSGVQLPAAAVKKNMPRNFVEKSGIEWDEYLYVKKFDNLLPIIEPPFSYLNIYCLQGEQSFVVRVVFEKDLLRVIRFSFDKSMDHLVGQAEYTVLKDVQYASVFSRQVDDLHVSSIPSIYTMTTHGEIYIIKASLERYNVFAIRTPTATIAETCQAKAIKAILDLLRACEGK